MPYPNEHACRLYPPGQVRKGSYSRLTFSHNGKKYAALVGKKTSDGKTVTQAYRYPKGTWDASSARAHCKARGGSFEAAGKG
jgi:hypothetical protein